MYCVQSKPISYRLSSRISLLDLDDESLTRLQGERADVASSLTHCLNTAQSLDDSVSNLGVVVHTDSQSGPAIELYDHTKKVWHAVLLY